MGNLDTLVNGAGAKQEQKRIGLGGLEERDLERGKRLFRRKRGKVKNLEGSGHKGLADGYWNLLEISIAKF